MARERVQWPVVVNRARQIVDGYAPLKVTLRQVMYRPSGTHGRRRERRDAVFRA